MEVIKIYFLKLSEDKDGTIIIDMSYEFSDSHENIWISKESYKKIIEFFER